MSEKEMEEISERFRPFRSLFMCKDNPDLIVFPFLRLCSRWLPRQRLCSWTAAPAILIRKITDC
jgi:hypothetical protein